MAVTRRQLFKHCLTTGLLAWLLPARAGQQQAPVLDVTLRAWLDVLIPADETPGAGQLGVDRDLLKKARKDDDYGQVLARGVAWLDRQARDLGDKDFLALDDGARESIASRAAAAGTESLEGLFFQLTRVDALRYYYIRPEAWHGLPGYHGPPQPLGYLDYQRPPGK